MKFQIPTRGGILKFRPADAISKSGAVRAKSQNFTQRVAASFKTAPIHVYGILNLTEKAGWQMQRNLSDARSGFKFSQTPFILIALK